MFITLQTLFKGRWEGMWSLYSLLYNIMLKEVHESVKNSAVICGYHAELFISYPFSHAVFFFSPQIITKIGWSRYLQTDYGGIT